MIQKPWILRLFRASKSTEKQSRNRLGFAHRHKLKNESKICMLSDIDLPIFRAWAPRRRGKGEEYLLLPLPLPMLANIYNIMLHYAVPSSVPASPSLARRSPGPRRRGAWGPATPPSVGSRVQRTLGSLNYIVDRMTL